MYYGETEVIFPARAIAALKDLRGPLWRNLVARLGPLPAHDPEVQAFVLMIARLANCAQCSFDTFRAMQGCVSCARRVVERFRGSDEELLRQYRLTLEEVQAAQQGQRKLHPQPALHSGMAD